MTIMFLMLILIGLAMLFMYKLEKKVDELEKKMDDYNELVSLMADHNVKLREKDDRVLDLLTRTLDNVRENAENAKDAMNLCVDILSAVKGDTNERNDDVS